MTQRNSHMQNTESLWFPDTDFVETITTATVPLLFSDYEYGEINPDFHYNGRVEGRRLLESALDSPRFHLKYGCPTIADMAAALIWSMTKNHPFTDGNKRAALTTGFFFLAFNKYILLAGQNEAVEMCKRVASSEIGIDQSYVSEWISERIVAFDEISTGDAEPNEKFVQYVESASDVEIDAFRLFCRTIAEAMRRAVESMEDSAEEPPFLSC